LQPFKIPFTVICAFALTDPLLIAVKDGMSPTPFVASPIPVLELLQVYVAPATLPEN